MTSVQKQLQFLLNKILKQTAKVRKSGDQLCYFCKCGHYKTKLEICIDPEDTFFGAYNCWVCGESGNITDLSRENNATQEQLNQLYSLVHELKPLKRTYTKRKSSDIELPPEFIPLSIKNDKCYEYKNAIFYLKKRGVLIDKIIRYNIGYCKSGLYDQHIIVPSYDEESKLNFFIGRMYYEVENSIPYKKPKTPMDDIIGFENMVNFNENISLCEGVFDAFALINAIPLYGKFISEKLLKKLIINQPPKINVVLDNDAKRESFGLCEKLYRNGLNVYYVELPDKDPSKLGLENTKEFIKHSKEYNYSLKFEL